VKVITVTKMETVVAIFPVKSAKIKVARARACVCVRACVCRLLRSVKLEVIVKQNLSYFQQL